MFYLVYFRQVQQWRGKDKRMWNPFRMLRTHIGKSSGLFIYILVIQDHTESIGKSILLKGDEMLLNGLLAQMLSDIAPKPSTTFSFQICPKPKVKLGPTDSIYPEPPSSYDIATDINPNNSVTQIQISVSPRWPYKLSISLCNISVSPK